MDTAKAQLQYEPRVAERIPLRGARKKVMQTLMASKDYAPQATAMFHADVSELIAFRKRMKARDKRVSFAAAFAKSAACALLEYPIMNSARLENEIIVYDSINISVAAFVDDTLFVPVLREAQSKDVFALTAEIEHMLDSLKSKNLDGVTLTGSTFTVSNLGNTIIEQFTPMLTVPETSILGIGRTVRHACANENDTLVFRDMANISMTTDHAVVDGMPKAQFLQYLQDILLSPDEHLLRRD